MTNDEITSALQGLAAISSDEVDQACDIIAEIEGERAAFGDSAPGSGAMLQSARAFLRSIDAVWSSLPALADRPAFGEGLDVFEPF